MYPQEFDYNDAALKWRTSKPDKKKKNTSRQMEKKKTTKSTQSMLMFVAIRKNNYKQTIYAYVLLINLCLCFVD